MRRPHSDWRKEPMNTPHMRRRQFLAGIAGGAEAVVIPEFEVGPEQVAAEIRRAYDRGKPHAIVVVAEGAKPLAGLTGPPTSSASPS